MRPRRELPRRWRRLAPRATSADGVTGAADGVAVAAGVAASNVTSSSAGAAADGAADGAAAGARRAASRMAPRTPMVADGPTGGSSWASAGLIAPSAISPAAKAGAIEKIATRRASGERGRLVEAPAALMFDHAPLVAELFQM